MKKLIIFLLLIVNMFTCIYAMTIEKSISESGEEEYIITKDDGTQLKVSDSNITSYSMLIENNYLNNDTLNIISPNNTTDIFNDQHFEKPATVHDGKLAQELNNYKYSIKNIEIKDKDGNTVNSLQNSSVLTSVTVVKNTEQNIPASIYAAVYDNKKLKTVKIIDIDNQLFNSQVKYELNLLLNNVDNNSSVNIMIWNRNTLVPYSPNREVFFRYMIDVTTVNNQTYTFPISSYGGANTYKVTFDKNFFMIDDLCKESENKITQTGNATENVTIDEITDQSVTFTFHSTQNEECVNRIVLRALKSGNTKLQVEEILP